MTEPLEFPTKNADQTVERITTVGPSGELQTTTTVFESWAKAQLRPKCQGCGSTTWRYRYTVDTCSHCSPHREGRVA